MADKRFDAVHMFLDESGDLAHSRKRHDLLLIGGVILFGNYDDQDDAKLRALLRTRLEGVGGSFPGDLHFFGQEEGRGITYKQRQQFLSQFNGDLREWFGDERFAYGVYLRHEEDVFSQSSGILGERFYDNRYLSMLWSLVEQLIFVDEGIRRRLSPDATVHLHIANRGYSFNPAEMSAELVESLGYSVKDDQRRPGYKFVTNSLNRREVATMMRMARRQRWGKLSPELTSVDVTSIAYEDRKSPTLLYLADLYLGTVRLNEIFSTRGKQPPVKMVLLDTLRRLRYGVGIELLAEMQAALMHENLEHYLELVDDYQVEETRHDLSSYAPIVRQQERLAAQLSKSSKETLVHLAESAANKVDLPGYAGVGLAKAQLAHRLLESVGSDDFRPRVLILQTRLSHANHTGDVEEAERTWNEYLASEPDLLRLGAEGLRLKAAMRNRHAVSLVDRFRHEDAIATLSQVVSEREEFLSALAKLYGVSTDELPGQQLAECLGSLGQVYAFGGTPKNIQAAEICFRRAASLFTDRADVRRQLVYLGQLACDLGMEGRALWDEVCSQIPDLNSQEPISVSGSQFLLALQLKGALVFRDDRQVEAFTAHLLDESVLQSYLAEERRFHPFGLIRQTMGMLCARQWHLSGKGEFADAGLKHFDAATKQMTSGGSLLQLLSYIARLRRATFALDVDSTSESAKKRLRATLAALKGYAMDQFGDHVWSEDDEGRNDGCLGKHDPGVGPQHPLKQRARSIVSAIRFNYW